MIPTLRILIAMGSLQRLFPLWLGGLAVMVFVFSPGMLLAVVYGVLQIGRAHV